MGVRAYSLWDRRSSLFDAEVYTAMTFHQYQWLTRHLSFADPASDVNALSPGDAGYDKYRKRRELTDALSAQFGQAFNPFQYVGVDDAPRPTRHRDTQRVRFKAAVHSAKLVDSLNDCKTGYCLGFEEQYWGPQEAHRLPGSLRLSGLSSAFETPAPWGF